MPALPGQFAFRQARGRALMGDRKFIGPAPAAAQLIDVEYTVPDFFLVVGVSRFSVTWKIAIGIDRTMMRTLEVGGDSFSYVVSARSISLTATAATADPQNVVSAMIVPITFSDMDSLAEFVDRAYLNQETFPGIGLTPGIAIAPLNSFVGVAGNSSYAASVSQVSFGNAGQGMTIYNDSASANLFISLGSTVTTTNFTCRLVPGAYYETPFGWSGQVVGVWDAAVGNARVTTIGVP